MPMFEKRLEKYEAGLNSLRQSTMWQSIKDRLPQADIEWIYCLGLGSPLNSNIALSQLTLLTLLRDHYKCSQVALYDPAFDAEDEKFLQSEFDYVIQEAQTSKPKTLYFLPHFPIDQLELFINNIEPEYMLSNDLTEYTVKFTDAEYFKRYPMCSRITKLITSAQPKKSSEFKVVNTTEFQVVSKKKKRKGKGNPEEKEEINYDLDSLYFSSNLFHTKPIPLGGNATPLWSSAFSDLSMMVLPRKQPNRH